MLPLPLASLSLALLLGGAAFGAQEERRTKPELVREQAKFSLYIASGENEYNVALGRRSKDIKLWQNNVVAGKVDLAITFKLMEGHQSRIAGVSAFWSDKAARKALGDNFTNLVNRAYGLQDKLNALVPYLDGDMKQFLDKTVASVTASDSPETTGNTALDGIKASDQQGHKATDDGKNNVVPQTDRIPLGHGFSRSADGTTVYGPDGRPMPGVSYKDGRLVFAGGYSMDPATGTIYGPDGRPIPGARYENGKILLPDGYWIDTATGIMHGGPQGTPIPGATERGGTVFGPGGAPMDPVRANTPLVDQDGKPIQVDRDWFDENGNMKQRRLRVIYTDVEEGHLDSEYFLKGSTEPRADGKVTFTQMEEPGTRIDWRLLINKAKSEPVAEGQKVTLELINDPPGPEFEVTAWQGPDGTRNDTSSKQFTVTLKPGDEVKAFGVTRKYKTKFTIKIKVN